MDKVVNKFKSMYKTSIIFSIILMCVGLFLLINPETTLVAISYFVGLVLIVWGLVPIIKYLTDKESKNYIELTFVTGIFSFIFGVIIMVKPTIIGSIIPLLLGLWMLINGGIKLYYSIVLNKETNSLSSIVISVVILICGFTLVCNPFGGAIVMTKLVGIFLIIYSVLDLIGCLNLNKTYKTIIKEGNNPKTTVIDVEYKEKKEKKKK